MSSIPIGSTNSIKGLADRLSPFDLPGQHYVNSGKETPANPEPGGVCRRSRGSYCHTFRSSRQGGDRSVTPFARNTAPSGIFRPRDLDRRRGVHAARHTQRAGRVVAAGKGQHALHSGKAERTYADDVGRKPTVVGSEIRAARVAAIAQISGQEDCFSQLVEIHAAPSWLWPVLVGRVPDPARWRATAHDKRFPASKERFQAPCIPAAKRVFDYSAA